MGGGVFGRGGRSVTFTSRGAGAPPSVSGARTRKPARAVTQSGSVQARSVTARRWARSWWTNKLLKSGIVAAAAT